MKTMKKGFTLVELMVVIVIIGVLAALAIPRFLGASNKAKVSEFKPVVKQVYTLQQAYRQEANEYGNALTVINFDAPKGNNGKPPYFSYTMAATAGTTGDYQVTATLQTTVGDATATETVGQLVDETGDAANNGSTNLRALARW